MLGKSNKKVSNPICHDDVQLINDVAISQHEITDILTTLASPERGS